MTIRPDNDPINADWTKQVRDYDINVKRTDAERARELGITLRQLRRLPSYQLPRERPDRDDRNE